MNDEQGQLSKALISTATLKGSKFFVCACVCSRVHMHGRLVTCPRWIPASLPLTPGIDYWMDDDGWVGNE